MNASGGVTPDAGADGIDASSKLTACALMTPLGNTPEDNWQKMAIEGAALNRSMLIPGVDQAIRNCFSGSPEVEKFDRVIKIAMLAAADALAQTDQPRISGDDALFIATSKGPILTLLGALKNPLNVGPVAAEQIALGPGAVGIYLQRFLGTADINHTSVAACAGSLAAVHRAHHALRAGRHRRAIVVAADSSIHPLFDSSFARLGILAPRDEFGNCECRPFDPAGKGFFITEAAAAVILERSQSGVIRLEKTWIGGDATDLLATDPGARSLRKAIRHLAAGKPIDFVHAHATGTRHDAYELSAIAEIKPRYVFSHKRFLGHSLGASGLVGLVLSAMCHRHQMTIMGDSLTQESASLTLAQGFGGHIGAVRLRCTNK
ncbi:MAG: beta-ketoacyl synthase N-terminal-like domain-containing protein [Phycisphaerae bacterium]